jgi:hypothetical protein
MVASVATSSVVMVRLPFSIRECVAGDHCASAAAASSESFVRSLRIAFSRAPITRSRARGTFLSPPMGPLPAFR